MKAKAITNAWYVVAVTLLLALAFGGVGCKKKSPKITPTVHGQYDDAIRAAKDWQGPINPAAGRLYEQGLEQYRAGNWDQAANLLGQAVDVGVTQFPMRPDAFIYQANALQKARKYLESAKVARQCIMEYPQRWEARVILAEYWLWRENYANAQQQLAAASRVAPHEPEVLAALARVQVFQGVLVAAVETARAARAARPDNEDLTALYAQVCLARGLHLEREGDLDAALTHYFLAASANEDDPTPLLSIGRVLLIRNRPTAARTYTAAGRAKLDEGKEIPFTAFAQPLTHSGDDVYEFLRMGDFYAGREQPEAAAQQYAQAVATEPRNLEGWQKLALLRHTQMQDETGARECLHALWLLTSGPESDAAVQLAKTLGVEPESIDESSPGFVLYAGVGTKPTPTDQVADFPVGSRLYFNLTLGKPVGKQQIEWDVLGPNGDSVLSESWTQEFFGRDTPLVTTGTWYATGEYQVQWVTDGAVRAKKKFRLK